MNIAILTLGMREKNDSVCNDVAYQYRLLVQNGFSVQNTRIFANDYDQDAFPDIPVEDVSALHDWVREDENVTVLFHYCDSRTDHDEFLRNICRNVIIRWHNATPPWFTFGIENQKTVHAVIGYENIIDFIDCEHIRFWANSQFTLDQLVALGASAERCRVVYPASRYLDALPSEPQQTTVTQLSTHTLDLLFVSRVVSHKGHANAIALAERVQSMTHNRVRLHIVGKGLDDQGIFASGLRRQIAASRADIVVHGLVSDEKLMSLYRTCDVFVCLSEHEGFGLPVFEAMRCRLPVVAWATTAFRELLDDHPFAFPYFNLDLFASAVLALENSTVRQELLEIQYSVLQKYSSPIVQEQIYSALAAFESSWNQPPIQDLQRNAVRFRPVIGRQLDEYYHITKKLYPIGFDKDFVFDAHTNLISLHDLRLFRTFLDQQKELISALTAPVGEASVTFMSDEFSIRKGVTPGNLDDASVFPQPVQVETQHLIFGPYTRLPAGKYSVVPNIVLLNAENDPIELEIDINASGEQLASEIFSIPSGRHRFHKSVKFDITSGNRPVEIRLRALRSFQGCLVFSGMKITKIPEYSKHEERLYEIETIKNEEQRIKNKERKSGALVWLKKAVNLQRARKFFQKGDAARDRKDYAEAAQFYTQGLALAPRSFGHLVQAGHMYKEIGNMPQALKYYSMANDINSEDADLCLQMGIFFKINNDSEKAEEFYKKALSLHGNTVKIAAAELLSMNRN